MTLLIRRFLLNILIKIKMDNQKKKPTKFLKCNEPTVTSQELHSRLFSLSHTSKPVALAQTPFTRKLFPQSVPKKSLKRQAEGWGALTELGFSWELFQAGQEVPLCWAEGLYAYTGLSPCCATCHAHPQGDYEKYEHHHPLIPWRWSLLPVTFPRVHDVF